MAAPERFVNFDTGQPQALRDAINSVMGASGANHAAGLVPDPGSSSGTTRFLREDGTWIAAIPDPGAWTAYSPTATPEMGAFGSSSVIGAFVALGKTIHFRAEITITTNGTGSSWINLSLPKAAAARASGVGRDIAISGKTLQVAIANSNALILNYDNTYPGADGALLTCGGTYEST